MVSRGAWQPLADGNPPRWASSWGEDRRGVWAGFSIGGVTQRMRWIRPGRFLMGSPEEEAGRFDSEGPQHEVRIRKGFWLGETPCTQALWQAVMGENPSRFQTADRPVEQVSFEDVQRFLQRAEDHHPGLDLMLPTEAQWEYACRAGTTTSTYAGDVEIKGDANAPGLDPIAWYAGNSGVDFELAEGGDLSFYSDRHHADTPCGTHPVGEKAPNPFGLQDILGNVWEWCADSWHEPYEGAPVDESAWLDGDETSERVVRGGSWVVIARFARAAVRGAYGPGGRDGVLGFRCARVQDES